MSKALLRLCVVVSACLGAASACAIERVDLLIRNGVVYDGSGGEPVRGGVAVSDGRIVDIGTLEGYTATHTVDARGLAVAPGFINVLSWATDSLMHDGRAMSDIKQGVTLEIFGEGTSWGPVNDILREEFIKTQDDIQYEITWTTLGSTWSCWLSKVSPRM